MFQVRYKGKLFSRESTVGLYPLHTWCLETQLDSETARPEYAKLTTANKVKCARAVTHR